MAAAAASSNSLRKRGGKKDDDAEKDDEVDKYKKGFKAGLLTLAEELFLLGLTGSDGSLSFWNESSFALRGCFMMDLEFRGKIGISKETRRRDVDSYIVEIMDKSETGEGLLDEVLKYVAQCDPGMTVSAWLDVLNGEDWSLFKSPYTMSQVRERLAKNLVDKGILRNEAQGFFSTQRSITERGSELRQQVATVMCHSLLGRGREQLPPNSVEFKRAVSLASAIQQAEFLDNTFDLIGLNTADRGVITDNIEKWRLSYLQKGDSKALYVEHPITNAVLTIFIEKD